MAKGSTGGRPTVEIRRTLSVRVELTDFDEAIRNESFWAGLGLSVPWLNDWIRGRAAPDVTAQVESGIRQKLEADLPSLVAEAIKAELARHGIQAQVKAAVA